MFKTYSATFVGLLTVVISQFLPADVAGELATDVVLVVGLVVTWWGRYRMGDISALGFRK